MKQLIVLISLLGWGLVAQTQMNNLVNVGANQSKDFCRIYPNPTKGNFQIEMPLKGTGVVNILVHNPIGETIQQTSFNIGMQESFRQSLTAPEQAGIYLVEIRYNTQRQVIKLIVQ